MVGLSLSRARVLLAKVLAAPRRWGRALGAAGAAGTGERIGAAISPRFRQELNQQNLPDDVDFAGLGASSR